MGHKHDIEKKKLEASEIHILLYAKDKMIERRINEEVLKTVK